MMVLCDGDSGGGGAAMAMSEKKMLFQEDWACHLEQARSSSNNYLRRMQMRFRFRSNVTQKKKRVVVEIDVGRKIKLNVYRYTGSYIFGYQQCPKETCIATEREREGNKGSESSPPVPSQENLGHRTKSAVSVVLPF